MPRDATLGLVVGLSLVITVGVGYFRKDLPAAPAAGAASAAPPAGTSTVPAWTAAELSPPPDRSVKATRAHTVREGETLSSLAEQYYGDGEKSSAIFQLNRHRLQSPESLRPGTVLLIPDLPPSHRAGGR